MEFVYERKKWYQTFLAGEQVDIRNVHARNRFESKNNIFLWPGTKNQKKKKRKKFPILCTLLTKRKKQKRAT